MLKKQFSKTKPTCKVTFTLAKEAIHGASSVKLLGEFNNWNPSLGVPMKLSGKEFKAVVELPIGRDYQFRYLADNGIWENDWAADDYVEVPFSVSNSVVSLTKKEAPTKSKATKAKSKANGSSKKANAKSDTKAKSMATGKAKSAANGKVKSITKSKKKTATKSKVKSTTKVKTAVDNLRKIEGIGPKIAQLLNKEGIKTFADLGKATKVTLKGILEKGGSRYKMHDPSTWAKQAKIAAKGDWAKLKQLQNDLVGGKKR